MNTFKLLTKKTNLIQNKLLKVSLLFLVTCNLGL
jgi:hypothetical protein